MAFGCGGDDVAADPQGTVGGTAASAETAAESGGRGTTGSSSGAIEDGVDASTGAPLPALAAGIQIDFVEANQGVGVRIGEDGGAVLGADRTSALLANRVLLVRALWTLADDWEPREIEAVLTLHHADGETEELSDRKLVDGPAFLGSLGRAFFWGIEAEKSQPGLEYSVALYEVDVSADEAPVPDPPPLLPADGSLAPVGVEDSYQLMKIVLVPFHYDDGGACVTTPDTSEATMQLFHDLMFMMNPLDRLDIEMHEPVEWDQPLEDFNELNTLMAGMREDEGALPEVYYYGLVDVCAGELGGFGGYAYGIPDDPVNPDNAWQRVSSGLSLRSNPEFSAETFVHEVGHCQGRRHVTCTGDEAGPDVSYPIPGGDVGEWGFGVVDFLLRHPTATKDYMTYCHPVWASTYGWNKTFPVIQGLSEWDADFPGAPGGGSPATSGETLLVGVILPSGRETWTTVRGAMPTTGLRSTRLEFEHTMGTTMVEGRVQALPDSAAVRIVAPLPVALSEVSAVWRADLGQRTAVDRAAIAEPGARG